MRKTKSAALRDVVSGGWRHRDMERAHLCVVPAVADHPARGGIGEFPDAGELVRRQRSGRSTPSSAASL